ncbi:MAG: metallophosphoesterase [Chitinophagaceae bacterium]|nr:metallophosphoesterase [Chitinophagaceae bacterium]
MERRVFVKNIASAALLLSSGKWASADILKEEVKLRFIVASDGHYGQPKTEYEQFFKEFVDAANSFHSKNKVAFTVFNGDIIHDDPKHFDGAKMALDKLSTKYYVTQGNHDHAGPELWQSVWKMPLNYSFSEKEYGFILATSSDEKGTYTCPDLNFIKTELEKFSKKRQVFLFIHINSAKQTANAVDCQPLLELLKQHKNVKAVFNGHDHDMDDVKKSGDIPFIFDAHIGGSWGTSYRGFRVVELLQDGSVHTYMMNPVAAGAKVVV